MAATVALTLPAPPGPSGIAPAGAERTIAEAIAGHRAARREILARADATRRTDAALSRQLEEALSGLRKLEAEFALFRAKANKRIEDAEAENERLSCLLEQARAGNAPNDDAPSTAIAAQKPFEKEISVSKLESSAAAQNNNINSKDRSKRRLSGRATEPVWRRVTISRSRSAQCVSPIDLHTDADSTSSSRRRPNRASTGGLFNRSSFTFPRTHRSSRASDRSSVKWAKCF